MHSEVVEFEVDLIVYAFIERRFLKTTSKKTRKKKKGTERRFERLSDTFCVATREADIKWSH